jgi:hypothetical protein
MSGPQQPHLKQERGPVATATTSALGAELIVLYSDLGIRIRNTVHIDEILFYSILQKL